MKKIGIATLYETDNYGTCLQAFALIESIKRFAYDCEVMQFNRNRECVRRSQLEILKGIGLQKAFDIILSKGTIKRQKQIFSNFRKTYLPVSEQKYTMKNIFNTDLQSYDAFVTGSDMVWSWESKEFLDYYFLRFVKKGKRIAYAPSFGNTEFTEEMVEYYMKALEDIDYLSCREEKGAQFVFNMTKRNCELVFDPTLLIEKKEWINFFGLKKENKNPTALVYIFGDIPTSNLSQLKKMLGKRSQIRYIPEKYSQYRHERKYGTDALGPVEYLERFYNADFVVTNTFHGLVFSLVFEKPFVLYHRGEEEHWRIHEERMGSLLNQLELSDRYLYMSEPLSPNLLTLDYSTLENFIDRKREESLKYLENALREATKG